MIALRLVKIHSIQLVNDWCSFTGFSLILSFLQQEKSTPPLPPGSCFCASLTDPYFPFIRCDGKSISKALLDVYAGADENPVTDEDKENETEVEPGPPNEHEPDIHNSIEPAKQLVLSVPAETCEQQKEPDVIENLNNTVKQETKTLDNVRANTPGYSLDHSLNSNASKN